MTSCAADHLDVKPCWPVGISKGCRRWWCSVVINIYLLIQEGKKKENIFTSDLIVFLFFFSPFQHLNSVLWLGRIWRQLFWQLLLHFLREEELNHKHHRFVLVSHLSILYKTRTMSLNQKKPLENTTWIVLLRSIAHFQAAGFVDNGVKHVEPC